MWEGFPSFHIEHSGAARIAGKKKAAPCQGNGQKLVEAC